MSVGKSREYAEVAFGHLQSQFSARGHAVEEMDHVTRAREEKTARLRATRLATEEQERLIVATKPAVVTRKRT